MYNLYSIAGSCSTGIHVLLNKLDVPVKIVMRDKVEDYSKLVPTNQVPALATDNGVITEGAAIALYLLENHGAATLTENETFMQWLMFNYATLHPAYGKLFSVSGLIDDEKSKQRVLQALADKVASLWAIVDTHLEGKEFMVNNEPTLIDYLLAVYVRWGNVFPSLSIPVGNNVVALVERVQELPEFREAFKSEGTVYSLPDNAMAVTA